MSLLELESRDVPTFLTNQLFPVDNPWNQVVSNAPVASNSNAIISRIINRHGGTAPTIHADFGNPTTDGALYGIPINVATSSTPKVTVVVPNFGYPSESDSVQVPIPTGAVIEGDGPTGPAAPGSRGDSHLLVYDRDANVLYELVSAVRPAETVYPYGGAHPTGQWGAYQVSYWDLNTNYFRTVGDTSADAAGLPILPGLVRPDEVNPAPGGAGAIDHAIRMTVQQVTDSFVFPASHLTTGYHATDLPRMGERFRLKASFVIPNSWSAEAKAIAQAMKTYGVIVADNGSDMFFQGTPSAQWNMSSVLQVQSIRASDFEVVDLTPIVTGLSTRAGAIGGGTSVTITGKNFSGAAGRLHVLFGTAEAASYTVVSDTQIVAVAPAHAAGYVDVRIQSGESEVDNNGQTVFFGYGTSANTAADDFAFGNVPLPPPPNAPPVSPIPSGRAPVLSPVVVNAPVGTQVIRVLNPGGSTRTVLTPHPGFVGGIIAAAGDVNGDGVADIVTAATFGGHVKVFDGVSLAELRSFYAFPGYVGAINLATGDITGDGVADLLVAANINGHVKVFDGITGNLAISFLAYAGYSGPIALAAADTNGDGRAELITAADGGPGVHVKALAPDTLALSDSFLATGPGNGTGFSVSAGDLDGDGVAEFLVAQGPRVRVIDSRTRAARADFMAFDAASPARVTVQAAQYDGDPYAELIAIAEMQGRSHVKAFDGPGFGLADSFFADTR
ncbi:FG-GAP-like repeat-containing protein [Gemmata palustris]|uniref:FG-GAP-like repeat-containing protein n=1 Tax=Gemmata palustris TaxID=2822762 RepID=UPI001FE6F768|nr:FG-GAP-like repeat-containing protein [Gemmata palustris]